MKIRVEGSESVRKLDTTIAVIWEAGMTRKFWITIDNDEDLDTRFRISMLPYRYRKAPKTKSRLSFLSHRTFGSERDAIYEARRLFGNVMSFRRDRAGRYSASLSLSATDISSRR